MNVGRRIIVYENILGGSKSAAFINKRRTEYLVIYSIGFCLG